MEHTLELMLHQLENMDDHLHWERAPLPTAAEIRLYGLIYGHVNAYIQLFLTEDESEVMVAQYSCTRPHEEESGPPHGATSTWMETQYSYKKHRKGEAGLPQGGEASSSPSQGYTITLPRVVCCYSVRKTFKKTLSNYIDIKKMMGQCRSLLPYSQHISALNSLMDAVSLADFGSKGCIGNKEPPPGLTDGGPLAEKRQPGPELEPGTDSIFHPAEVAPAMASDCDMDVVPNEHTEKLKEARLRFLDGILRQLIELGRLRSYAPPTDREVEYYRRIRKQITSSLALVKAKAREFVKGPAAAARETWFREPLGCHLHTISCYPKGHMLATVLDTLPGCLSLLQELLPRMASLCSHFYTDSWGKKLSQDASSEKCDHSSQVIEELEARCHLPSGKEKGKLTALFPTNLPTENGNRTIHEKKTRAECLLAMIKLFRRIASSFSTTLLNTRELRLFAQIQEHVLSSIWLFRTSRLDCLEQKAQEGKNGPVQEFLIAPRNGSRETRSREEDLQEIIVLVEVIRSLFLDVMPTQKEIQLYYKLNRCIWDALAHTAPRACIRVSKKRKKSSCTPEDSSCTPGDGSKKREKSFCTSEDATYIKNLVESIYSWELKWLQKLYEEYRKIIRMIIPSTSTGLYWAACWRKDDICRKIMDEFEGQLSPSRQQKLKILDGMLVMLEKAQTISGEAYCKIMDANDYLDSLVKEKKYVLVMEEVLSFFRVLQRSSSFLYC